MSTLSTLLRASATLGLVSVTACATIISGTTEQIAVNTNPSGAACDFMRNGQRIAEIPSTPASSLIQKTKYDITIVCRKAGYQDASYLNHSGAAGATFGNIVLGGFIGWGIDSATGSDNYLL